MLTRLTRLATHSPIGLDIGHTGVRAVQLARNGDGWVVDRVARTKQRELQNGGVREDQDLCFAVRACISSAPFRGKKVVVGLTPPDVDFHTLQLPDAIITKPHAELQPVVSAELQRMMPDQEESFQADYWCLPASRMGGPNVLSAVAKHAAIERALSACDEAGLDCRVMDSSSTALVRAVRLLGDRPPDSLWGVLDMGYRQTRLVLCIEESPVLMRTAGTGASAWTARIAESFGISTTAAEIHKCRYGVSNERRPRAVRADEAADRRSPLLGSDLGSMILGTLRSDLTALAAEIKRSYEYVLSCYPDKRAADLVLTGGGARMRGLSEFLESELGISIAVGFGHGDRGVEALDQGGRRLAFGTLEPKEPEDLVLAIGLAIGA